jgi:CRISPR-associated endonuclease/helicase Cas3
VSFARQFEALTGFYPMNWQSRMFERFVANDLPDVCDIPTGLGKTSILVIWLLALVRQANVKGTVTLPRRMVYVVNRRTVVDQATEIVEQLRTRLVKPEDNSWREHSATLRHLVDTLRSLTASDDFEPNQPAEDQGRHDTLGSLAASDDFPLAVSTLRGERADNELWKVDPARPAIVIGTIDMIGSKLLFSGYGDGRYGRAHHAGLIGQDSLIVHDEAHLTPAFSELIKEVEGVQARDRERDNTTKALTCPIRTMDLSATSRGTEGDVFVLGMEDERDKIVRDRVDATKRLRVVRANEEGLVAKLIECSREHEEARVRVLIYVRSPEQAHKVASALIRSLGKGCGDRVALLTGTIRGHERDQLVATNPVYRAMLDHDFHFQDTMYLISTSAGEVGIDLDADHMVCDLTTLDSMIQRLGRVNRRGGEGRAARICVVMDVGETRAKKTKETALDRAISATSEILMRWIGQSEDPPNVDVSPGRLREFITELGDELIASAFAPRSSVPPLTDVLLDAWSLTSINKMPGRPAVAAYLHGLTQDPPQTSVCWRKEVALLNKHGVPESALSEWFSNCRVETRELFRDRTDRVKKGLAGLLTAHRKKGRDDFPVVLLDERGEATWSLLSDIVVALHLQAPASLQLK